MNIGQRLRDLREAKGLGQGHIEKRTGLLRCYVSRVECGHTEPKLETLEKWAKALDLELYQLFYEGRGEPVAPQVPGGIILHWTEKKLIGWFRQLAKWDQGLLLGLAREAVKRQSKVPRRKA